MPIPQRDALEAMKRVDIQKLCKDYGVKANLKTEALIELLLQASQPKTQHTVSTRTSSRMAAKPQGRSGAIVHDSDHEEQERDGGEVDIQPVETDPEPQAAPRTRKAKETQTKLGMGRPAAIGGSAARRSTGGSKTKHRGKMSKSMKQTEGIPEDDTEMRTVSIPIAAPKLDPVIIAPDPPPIESPTKSSELAEDIDMRNNESSEPLHKQILNLKLKLAQMELIKADVERLTQQVASMSGLQDQVKNLANQIEILQSQSVSVATVRAEVQQMWVAVQAQTVDHRNKDTATRNRIPIGNSTPGPSSQPHILQTVGPKSPVPLRPGIAPSTLGKRHRNSTMSDVTGVYEEGQQDELSETELAKRVERPNKKRPKISSEAEESGQREAERASGPHVNRREEEEEEEETDHIARVPAFNVFSEPDKLSEAYSDPPPPTTHLPDYFAPSSPSSSSNSNPNARPATSTAHAAENRQHPFGFSFTSTPMHPLYPNTMPSFPYPEPPQSPSPMGHAPGGVPARLDSGIFQTFGLPSPTRPKSRTAFASGGASSRPGAAVREEFVNPAMLSQQSSTHVSERQASSVDVAAGLGLTAIPAKTDTHTLPMKRTMYGTELEGDTRFGDFGVEGVASGTFWAGGR